jgi:NAD(P)H-dependent FMN reductase
MNHHNGGQKMKLLSIVGTNHDNSTNRQLLKFIQDHFNQLADIEVAEIKDLPVFNEPEERIAPQSVQNLSDKISEADGVIIGTPEYDHTIPAVLKNAIEWLSYTTRSLIDKPVMIVGASNGALGSSRAQAHLRQILDAPELKARVLPSNEFLLGHSIDAFDEQGDLRQLEKVQELESCFNEFLVFVELTNELLKDNRYKTEKARQFSWNQFVEGEL